MFKFSVKLSAAVVVRPVRFVRHPAVCSQHVAGVCRPDKPISTFTLLVCDGNV